MISHTRLTKKRFCVFNSYPVHHEGEFPLLKMHLYLGERHRNCRASSFNCRISISFSFNFASFVGLNLDSSFTGNTIMLTFCDFGSRFNKRFLTPILRTTAFVPSVDQLSSSGTPAS